VAKRAYGEARQVLADNGNPEEEEA
jgi:hypothetical protein